MLQCIQCGQHGAVVDPSESEWAKAFHAPKRPYRWVQDERVCVQPHKTASYVALDNDGNLQRVPREIIRSLPQINEEEAEELVGMIDLVESPEYELPPETGSDSQPSNGEESLDESKSRWDRTIGMTSLSCGNNRFVFCSPTGFPLADMELNQNDTGRFEASFGHPIAMQNDWLKESKP